MNVMTKFLSASIIGVVLASATISCQGGAQKEEEHDLGDKDRWDGSRYNINESDTAFRESSVSGDTSLLDSNPPDTLRRDQ